MSAGRIQYQVRITEQASGIGGGHHWAFHRHLAYDALVTLYPQGEPVRTEGGGTIVSPLPVVRVERILPDGTLLHPRFPSWSLITEWTPIQSRPLAK